MPGCGDIGNANVMEMIYPKNLASIYIPLELDGKRGKVVMNATHRRNKAKVYWHIDNEYIGTTENFHQFAISPTPGKHTLTLVDDQGQRLVQTFTVLNQEQ
ncbi:MAG: hypothetical protein EOP48_12055 [Sphingobacteriales bacterium]|nr:MAG: hypothetical protein EOP48_12055 [Sphingobacteriales bacterium]